MLVEHHRVFIVFRLTAVMVWTKLQEDGTMEGLVPWHKKSVCIKLHNTDTLL